MKSNPNYFELWSIKVHLTLLEANIVVVVVVVVDVVVNVVVMVLLHIRSCVLVNYHLRLLKSTDKFCVVGVVCRVKSNYSRG